MDKYLRNREVTGETATGKMHINYIASLSDFLQIH